MASRIKQKENWSYKTSRNQERPGIGNHSQGQHRKSLVRALSALDTTTIGHCCSWALLLPSLDTLPLPCLNYKLCHLCVIQYSRPWLEHPTGQGWVMPQDLATTGWKREYLVSLGTVVKMMFCLSQTHIKEDFPQVRWGLGCWADQKWQTSIFRSWPQSNYMLFIRDSLKI